MVTDETLAPLAGAVADRTDSLYEIITVGETYEALLAESPPAPPVDVPDSAPALIMYTSGTTGRPKGAVLTHSNMAAQSLTCIRALQMRGVDEIGFCASPMFHIAALGSLAPNLQLGIPTVVYPVGAFDPAALLDVLEAEGVPTLFLFHLLKRTINNALGEGVLAALHHDVHQATHQPAAKFGIRMCLSLNSSASS